MKLTLLRTVPCCLSDDQYDNWALFRKCRAQDGTAGSFARGKHFFLDYVNTDFVVYSLILFSKTNNYITTMSWKWYRRDSPRDLLFCTVTYTICIHHSTLQRCQFRVCKIVDLLNLVHRIRRDLFFTNMPTRSMFESCPQKEFCKCKEIFQLGIW